MGATAPGRGCCGTPGVRATGWGRRAAPVLRQQPCGSHLSLAPGSVLSRSAICALTQHERHPLSPAVIRERAAGVPEPPCMTAHPTEARSDLCNASKTLSPEYVFEKIGAARQCF